jgi:hypothetical protein
MRREASVMLNVAQQLADLVSVDGQNSRWYHAASLNSVRSRIISAHREAAI